MVCWSDDRLFCRLPVDGTEVLKLVGVNTYQELYIMFGIHCTF